ncbi:MAG: M12 family metallo-peptidase [Woeseiaceae bacterium]
MLRNSMTAVAAALMLFFLATSAQASDGFHVVYEETLDQLELIRPTLTGVQQKTSVGDVMIEGLRFEAMGQRFDIQLTPNRSLLSEQLRYASPSNIVAFKGVVQNMSGSWVRIVMDGNQPSGLIWTGTEYFAVEWREGLSSKIFRLADVEVDEHAFGCGVAHKPQNAADLAKIVGEDMSPLEAAGANSEIRVGVIADALFTEDKGAGVDAAVIARMNIVDGIFSEQVGVQLTVTDIETNTAATDPFSATTDSGDLLDEVSDYRSGSAAQRANGLSHLFTGRNLDGTTVGIAYRGALCSSRFGTGLTQATGSNTRDALILAHEFGHNFGAPHDGTENSACETTEQDFLMAPRLNGSDTFSACSLTQIAREVSSASCVTELATSDVEIVRGAATQAVLLGDSATIDFEVNSIGTDAAANVRAEVDLPAGVTLDSATATGGTCTNGAQQAICDIGNIASGSGSTVTLNVTTDAVGDQSFSATVSATDDADANNNTATETLGVDPLVDVSVAATPSATITIDQQTTLRPRIDNLASISASDIVVTITPAADLRIDSVDWAAGTCTIDANNGSASCEAASIGAQSNNAIDLQVTGTATGSLGYDVTVSAAETERNMTNNESTGNVTVNAVSNNNTGGGSVTGGGDDSGGGSFGLFALLGLGLIRLVRRRV